MALVDSLLSVALTLHMGFTVLPLLFDLVLLTGDASGIRAWLAMLLLLLPLPFWSIRVLVVVWAICSFCACLWSFMSPWIGIHVLFVPTFDCARIALLDSPGGFRCS